MDFHAITRCMWIQRPHAPSGSPDARRSVGKPRLLDSLDRFVSAWGLPSYRLGAQELMEWAARHTGLADFGCDSFEEPLRVLTQCYEEEASLSAFGRMTARWDMLRFLSNLLMLRQAEAQDPAILEEAIEQPIFITGLPRSATSFLHTLFSQDPANRIVRCWETIYPCTTRGGRPADPDPRAAKVARQLDAFAWLAPDVRRLYPMSAHAPQECTEITAHVFRSLRFDTTHHVPTYRRWLDEAGHLEAYRFHRRFLQHLQHRRGPGRWVLKSPDHVFALEAIRAIYPDACFIFMHRNPLDVLASVAELTEVLRRPFTRRVDRAEIGSQISDRWAHGADILVAWAPQLPDSSRVAHLEFRDVVQQPLQSVVALYERFGLAFSDELGARIRALVAAWPNGGDRRDRIPIEEYGLRTEAERCRYRTYMTCFGL
jgi:hypothetical protein